MEGSNPVKSFGPAKGLNASKFFDRIRFRDVAALVGAIAVLLFAIGISSVSYKLHKESTQALGNHARVEENSELTYYLTVKSDGIDKNGVQSTDSVTSNIGGGITTVTDKIPNGLEFIGFETTETGTIGAVARSDSATSCSGHVIDDTKEEMKDAGTWNSGRTEFFYHGLHYDVATRTVSFKAENIQAGCDLTVGVITKTPSLGNNTRMDFYNTAKLKADTLNLNSNTFHSWMALGKEEVATYDVTYAYTGTVPDNAPSAPATQAYAEGASVGVEPSPNVDGYQFSGWQTSDVAVSSGSFTMPASTVAFTGSFTAKPSATKYNVTYVIDGDAPADYVAPKTKQYEAGQTVTLDSLSQNAKIDDWSFDGWTSENAELSDRGFTMPADDVEIHGSFTQDTYKVTYAFEGETLPPNANALLPAVQEYPAGTKVTLADNPSADGYAFTGWYQADTFTMPAEDVTIYGEWSVQNGVFSPEISIKLAGEQKKYREGDAVVFEISIKNPASYPITDVQVMEQMEGAYFTENPNYALKNEQFALISEIPAGETKTVYAEYIIPSNEDAEFTNTVQLAGAVADGYTLSTDQEYLASIDFQSEYYVAPVPGDDSGDDSKDEAEQGDIVNTLDNITNYGIIGLIGLIGIVISAVLIAKTIKNDQLQGLKATAPKLSGLKNFFNPNTATKGRLTAMAVADVALIAIVAGLILGLPQKATGENTDLATINLMSSDADYNAGEGGAWKLTKSAKWIGDGEAEVTIDIDTKKQSSDKKKDIVFAVDTSGSMEGDKLAQVKSDMAELIGDLLDDQENQVALVSFESEAKVELGFTDDKESALSAIDGLETGNNTNYYDALTKVEDVLSGYSEDSNRELYVLILTDGLPTVGSPNELGEYAYLKQAFPYATIGAVQYEMNSSSVFAPVARISDEQYIADMDSLHNTLYDVVAFPYTYTTFTVTDLVNSEHFTIAGSDSIIASTGDATLTDDNGTPKITWDMSGKLRSGSSAKLTIKLKLKDEFKRVGGEYLTNKSERAISSIEGKADEDKFSTESPRLRNNYTVTYEANAPSDCTVSGLPNQEEHFVYQVTEISETVPTCSGYNFAGYVVMSDVAKRFNEDYFRMPEADVTIKATWTKMAIEKKAEGEIYIAKTLYNAIAKKTQGLDTNINFTAAPSSSNGQGVYTFVSTEDDENPVYYFRGDVADNNVLFAGFCWKAVRTTSTGGVKLVYGKEPNASGQCTYSYYSSKIGSIGYSAFNSSNSPAYVGYMYGNVYTNNFKGTTRSQTVLYSSSLQTSYWYADSATYGSPTSGRWNLVDAYQVSSTSNYSSLVGKYTFANGEQAYTNNTVRYIVAVSGSTYYYISLSGNTSLETEDQSYIFGDSYTDNGDGTYDINNPVTVRRSEWLEQYRNLVSKYICAKTLNDDCVSVGEIIKTDNTSYRFGTPSDPYKYASGFSYEDGYYTLDSSTAVSVWNTLDSNELSKIKNAHYTCFNDSGECTTLYYITHSSDGLFYYIELKNGKGFEDALGEMQTNTNNSTIKTKVDTWYEDNIKGTDVEKIIEDTVYCNDRSIENKNTSWIIDSNSLSGAISFSPYTRRYTTKHPSLDCSSNNDSFTVSKENGNGDLTYPVGLLTEDEFMLFGYSDRDTYVGRPTPVSRSSWSLSPRSFAYSRDLGFSALGFNGTPSYYAEVLGYSSGVSPVVSIAPETMISSGNGTQNSPWELELPE